jgi:hypothetical protein
LKPFNVVLRTKPVCMWQICRQAGVEDVVEVNGIVEVFVGCRVRVFLEWLPQKPILTVN